MTEKELEDRIRQVEWPATSQALRSRTLSAARVSAVAPISWSDRVWFSRGWRMTAAAAVVVLVGLFVGSGPVAPIPRASEASSQQVAIEDFMRESGFPADVARAVAHRSRPRATRPVIDATVALGVIEGGN